MSVWVIESNGAPFRSNVGDVSMGRKKTKTWIFDSKKTADQNLTRCLNKYKGRDGRKKPLNLVVVEYVRKP